MAKRLINICNHVQYGLSRCVTEILRSELGVLILPVCRDNAAGRIDDGTQSILIKEVYKILALAALCTVTRHKDIGLRHNFP